jgi:hypothetical protein
MRVDVEVDVCVDVNAYVDADVNDHNQYFTYTVLVRV